MPLAIQSEDQENPTTSTDELVANLGSELELALNGAGGGESRGKYYPDYDFQNITSEFFEACSELALGELVHLEIFGLFEAMSAIEMMDPKMDVGMGFDQNEPPPHTFETAVAAGVLKLSNLDNSELIGLFDSLYAGIVSWLEGHSLDQILFTCLYLHAPDAIEDKSLQAFCIATRKFISLVKQLIVHCEVYAEEDFQIYENTNLVHDVMPNSKVINLLKESEDELVKRSKTETNSDDTFAVIHRLRFLRFLFQSLHGFSPKDVPSIEQDIVDIQKYLNAALELVPLIQKTIDKGTQPDPNSEAPNPMGYSPRVNQRNLPPTFPRTAKIRDRQSSLQFLEELVHRLKSACKVVHQKDYHSALNFFIEFSKKSGQCLLSRSVLQTIFLPDQGNVFGSVPFEDYLRDSIRAFISPPALNPKSPLANDRYTKTVVHIFLSCCMKKPTMMFFLQLCGYNRARQRDKLARLIEEGFSRVQEQAGHLDSHFNMIASKSDAQGQHIAYFGTWALYNCLRAMSMFLLSGFELELYSVHEFMYIFWYLFEFLFGFLISALTRAESIVIDQEAVAEQQNKTSGGKQKKPKQKKKKQLKLYRPEIVLNHAMQNLCGGYYKAMGAFTKDERIRQPMPKFDNEQIRFNHRFSPFVVLSSPPPIPYEEYIRMRDQMMRPSATELYLSSAKHFHQARLSLESIQNPDAETTQMLQIAKVNFVVTNLLANGHKRDSKTQPDFDFSQHRYFPIIKLN